MKAKVALCFKSVIVKKYTLLGLVSSLLFTSCLLDDDYDLSEDSNVAAQHFMWKAMNFWYLWQGDVPDLADNRFASEAQYTAFLRQTPHPELFFYQICNKYIALYGNGNAIDRFSFLDKDYTQLFNSISGVFKTNGLEFGITAKDNKVFGYVQYVTPKSNAAGTSIKRGDIFTRVNGQQLTRDNWQALLFGNNDTYTLAMADINEQKEIVDTDREVTLTKIQSLAEDPILIATTFTINGITIAYLMYNRFLSSSDEALNTVFGNFLIQGATELVLDLRYNPGGDVNTSRLLASMIYGTHTDQVYIKQYWNSKIQPLLSEADVVNTFASTTPSNTPINSLNLSRVYVLATRNSASASELVINGLAPHMDVIHIGDTTRGKNEFSITLVDDPANFFTYSSQRQREGKINTTHSWGLQPLVGISENANGFSEYTEGLPPDIVLQESLSNMGELGNPDSEPLLARAIQEITGSISQRRIAVQPSLESLQPFTSSRLETPIGDHMYLDTPPPINME